MQLKYLNFFIGSGILFRAGVVAHWLDCQPTNLEMRGSNPTDCWAFPLPLTNPNCLHSNTNKVFSRRRIATCELKVKMKIAPS